jgi:hypothetical protein
MTASRERAPASTLADDLTMTLHYWCAQSHEPSCPSFPGFSTRQAVPIVTSRDSTNEWAVMSGI